MKEKKYKLKIKTLDGMTHVVSFSVPCGEDGHSPEKGVDYWTERDKAEIVSDVLASLPNGDEVSY